ncbi:MULTISPECIES: hypothetical protein [Flavobacteriaceae]|uniref:hypothetical protein n=1 Tax=Flavobacteriaceae TaxID=49546 RepID=UPI001491C71A|nr:MULTISPECIES: hypothetical protein [Allomuricauda]MDC6367229.1 hypothetical protein [Muricauda sp. AC10]
MNPNEQPESNPTTPLIFNSFGNVGIAITDKVKALCDESLGYGLLTKLALICLEEEQDMFVLLTPDDEKIFFGFFDTSRNDLNNFSVPNSKGLERDVTLYYENARLMLLEELPIQS